MHTELENEIRACFAGIIGQPRIVGTLVRAAMACAMGGPIPSYAFLGQAGLGKTHLMRALENAVRLALKHRGERTEQTLWVRSPEKFRLLSSDEFGTVKTHFSEVHRDFNSILVFE